MGYEAPGPVAQLSDHAARPTASESLPAVHPRRSLPLHLAFVHRDLVEFPLEGKTEPPLFEELFEKALIVNRFDNARHPSLLEGPVDPLLNIALGKIFCSREGCYRAYRGIEFPNLNFADLAHQLGSVGDLRPNLVVQKGGRVLADKLVGSELGDSRLNLLQKLLPFALLSPWRYDGRLSRSGCGRRSRPNRRGRRGQCRRSC